MLVNTVVGERLFSAPGGSLGSLAAILFCILHPFAHVRRIKLPRNRAPELATIIVLPPLQLESRHRIVNRLGLAKQQLKHLFSLVWSQDCCHGWSIFAEERDIFRLDFARHDERFCLIFLRTRTKLSPLVFRKTEIIRRFFRIFSIFSVGFSLLETNSFPRTVSAGPRGKTAVTNEPIFFSTVSSTSQLAL